MTYVNVNLTGHQCIINIFHDIQKWRISLKTKDYQSQDIILIITIKDKILVESWLHVLKLGFCLNYDHQSPNIDSPAARQCCTIRLSNPLEKSYPYGCIPYIAIANSFGLPVTFQAFISKFETRHFFFWNFTFFLSCFQCDKFFYKNIELLTYLCRESTEEGIPEMTKCKCKIFVEKILEKFAHSKIAPSSMNQQQTF